MYSALIPGNMSEGYGERVRCDYTSLFMKRNVYQYDATTCIKNGVAECGSDLFHGVLQWPLHPMSHKANRGDV